ncbi:MAG: FAD-binding protein, partial [Clostridia bacterium]|nr:FAD-binding protein [Clostridia bacterium]
MNEYVKQLLNMGAAADVDMSRMTTFKIGGKADLFFEPSSSQMLCEALAAATACKMPVTVIGNGSNLLVSDYGVEGLVIKIGDAMSKIKQDKEV